MAAKGSRVRFELGRLEVAGLVVSTAAGLFVVFLLGIYAGRGMAERRLELDDALVRLPVDAVEKVRHADDELTFYETLARDEAEEASAPAADAGTGTSDRVAAVVAATVDEEALPADGAATRDTPPPAPERQPESAPQPQPERAPVAVPEEPEARVAMAVVAEPAPPAAASRGEWSVQVAAPRDPRHAERIKRQLTGAGYRAYIVQTRRQGETYHRVRVGYYASLDAAREAASSLRHQPGITGAFVASD
jgi:cell division septation protein DedD